MENKCCKKCPIKCEGLEPIYTCFCHAPQSTKEEINQCNMHEITQRAIKEGREVPKWLICTCFQSTNMKNKEICKLCKHGGFTLPPPCPHQSTNTEVNECKDCEYQQLKHGEFYRCSEYPNCQNKLQANQVSKEESWKEEFDKNFIFGTWEFKNDSHGLKREGLKSFIQEQITKAYKEGQRNVNALRIQNLREAVLQIEDRARNELKASIFTLIEETYVKWRDEPGVVNHATVKELIDTLKTKIQENE